MMKAKTLCLILVLGHVLSCSSQRAPDKSAKRADSPTDESMRVSLDKTTPISQNKPSLDTSKDTSPPGKGLGPQGPPILIGSTAAGAVLRAPQTAPREGNALLVAIDTPYQIFRNQCSYVHVAAWRTDGTPAPHANVFLGNQPLGKTDAHGTLVFMYPQPGTKDTSLLGSHVLTVVDGKDANLQGSVPFSPQLRTASFASDHVFVYTDRGVYRPGDNLHLRSIAWHLKQDYTPLQEKDLEFQLRDPRGKVITGARVTTDTFGIGSATLKLPPTIKEGAYTLKVSYKQATQTARIQIRDFTPPNIQIDHDLGRFLTRAQKQLQTQVTLRPSSGKTFGSGTLTWSAQVQGATVFETSKTVQGPGPHMLSATSAQLQKLQSKLRPGLQASMKLRIQQGTQAPDEVVRQMRYTLNPYVAVLEADKDQYTTDDQVTLVAKVRDLDGVPLRGKTLTLKYDKRSWTATTDQGGAAIFKLDMGSKTSTTALHIQGVDAPIATTSLRWSAPRAMVSRVQDAVIQERKKARVEVRFPSDIKPVESVVHMDVVDTSGALVNAVLLPVTRDKTGYVARGSFHAPSWGSMLLTFFALGRETDARPHKERPHHTIGLLTEGVSMVVRPDKELKVTLDGIPEQAQPGQKLQVNATVKDAQGQPVRASVGVALVDRRVLSLRDPLEITPMDMFYEPTLRTMSTTGSKILSWPVVSRNWGSRRHDVALPPFPFLAGGAVTPVRRQHAPSAVMKEQDEESEVMDNKGAIDGFLQQGAATTPAPKKESKKHASRRRKPTSQPANITIRTRFQETSLWRPHLQTSGTSTFDATLPDAMAEQEFMVVASDARGGVGLARARVRVTQPLHVKAHFPATLRAGTSLDIPITVTNNSNEPRKVLVALNSTTLRSQIGKQHVTVPDKGTATVLMRVHAKTPGEHAYQVGVSAPQLAGDLVDANVRVLPAGTPTWSKQTGTSSRGKTWKATWNVSNTNTGNDAFLHVSFPAMTSGVVDIERLTAHIRNDPLSLSSDLVTAALVLQYARQHKLSGDRIQSLRTRLLGAVGGLYTMQHRDGGFSYWRSRRKSAMMTAWALEGLLEVQRADIPVQDKAIQNAASWLVSNISKDDLFQVSEIAFWQGDTKAVRLGITAEIFDILASLPRRYHTLQILAFLQHQTKRFTAYLETQNLDPLTAGRALQALGRLKALSPERSRVIIKRLLQARNARHWEPSWFHAYAGKIEATTAMISAMQGLAPSEYAPDIRDALSYILASREAWGTWHNERGTAAALRALLLVGAAPNALGGTLTITRNGAKIASVKVDPRDPFGSTLPLRHVHLGQNLPAGTHTFEVTYTGKLNTTLTLGTREWRTASPAPQAGVQVKAPHTTSVGSNATMSIQLDRPKAGAPANLHISPLGLGEADLARLSAWVEETPEVKSYQRDETGITLALAPTYTSLIIPVPYKLQYVGEGSWPTVSMRKTSTSAIMVTAGKLKVE